MTFSNRLAVFAACALVVCAAVPAFAKDAQPYNAADAARKYCGGAYKRYCKKVPPGGIESFNCLKANERRLPRACRRAVNAL